MAHPSAASSQSAAAAWRPADALLLVVVVVWGTDFAVLKEALAVMSPHAANALRFTVSAVVLGGFWTLRCWRTGTAFFAPLTDAWRRLLPLGLLGFGAHQVFFVVGLNHTTAGTAALLMATNPVWTALLSWLLGSEPLDLRGWSGLLVSLCGTALVVATGTLDSPSGTGTLFGNGMMLGAAMLWGGYTALSKRVLDQRSPTATAFFGVAFSLPLLVAVGALYDPALYGDRIGGAAWSAILFSGGLAVGLMFVLWNRGVQRVGASNTAAYYYLVPVVGLIAGALMHGDPVTLSQGLGGLFIVGGLVLVRR